MPPKKKAAGGGDPSKGEKIFKNLCSACHSLSVRRKRLMIHYRLTQPVPPSVVLVVTTSQQEKVSAIPQRWLPRPR